MAAPMTAAQTRVQMKKWLGSRFKEYSGWTTRKRPGSFAPVGIVIHHTGSDSGQNSSSYDSFLFQTGRPAEGIPGPLCNATCEMDGDLIVGAIGRANHAGNGSATTLAAVKADKVSLVSEIKPGPDGTNGNGWYYGLEVKFDGGQPMTGPQYDSAVRYAAAICDFYGWGAGSIIGHKEHTRRKDDPGHTNMATFRRDVAARLKAGPGGETSGNKPTPPPVTNEGDFTVAEADRVIAQINNVSGHLSDNARQNRQTETADLTKVIRDELAASEARITKNVTDFVEARVQAYAGFGAKHTDQVVGPLTDSALADDVQSLKEQLGAIQEALAKLAAPADGGDAPKA